MKNESIVKYGIILCLYAAMTGLNWDVAWHILLVRESMWQPPHIVMYVFVSIAISLGILRWMSTRSPLWRKIAIALFGIPTAIGLDELWHIFFFEEEITSIWMTLSPPHLLVIATFVYTAYLICQSFEYKTSTFRTLCFQACTIAIILNCLLTITIPMDTLRHFHGERIYTAWVVPFVFTSVFYFARNATRYKWSALFVVIIYISLAAFSFPANSPGMIIMAYDQPIYWISISAYLLASICFDCVPTTNRIVRGGISGCIFGCTLYVSSYLFVSKEYVYPFFFALLYILQASIGGMIAGYIARSLGYSLTIQSR